MAGPSVFFIIGAKGGVGATTVSVELAKLFSARSRTLLVDGDLSGRRSEAVLFNAISEIDAKRQNEDFGVVDVARNLALFEMTPNVHGGFTIKADKVESWFAASLQKGEQTVVLDAPQPFAAAVRPFAVRSRAYALVIEPTLLGVTGARAMQLELLKFGVPQDRICGVICQRTVNADVVKADIEKHLGINVIVSIPPNSEKRYAQAMQSLADALMQIPENDVMTLQPSAKTPLGDRRLGRPAAPAAGNGQVHEHTESRIAERPPLEEQDARDTLKGNIHRELSKRVDFVAIAGGSSDQLKLSELRKQIEEIVTELVGNGGGGLGSAEDIAHLRQEIVDEALGFGPLEDLMGDPAVSEIMVNGPDMIYIERGGKVSLTNKHFNDSRQLRLVIERIIAPIGRHIDEASPMVDARLADGSRVNATIEPLSLDGPTITIRRFGKHRMSFKNLIAIGSITAPVVDLLRAAVEGRLNIIISGGTGSGKTTLLNILSSFIPTNERIITIEDAAELSLQQDHVVRMEARPANVEGRGEIRIRDLVKNSLRMRPDRIVVGECRGGEALDMLQAMNTGHDGSLTTVHANTPRDCLSRIETMVLMAGYDIPVRAIREQIAGAVDLIVQTARMRDGSRKVTSVTEVVGMEGDVVTTHELVRFDAQGLDKQEKVAGNFVFTGVQPYFLKRLEEYGVNFDIESLNSMQLAVANW